MAGISAEDGYRTLFTNNIAAVSLSTPEGCIVDCNDVLVEIFGFGSRTELLTHNAWEFYFDRKDRDASIQPDMVIENQVAQELPFRHKTGRPVWLRYTRAVVSRTNGRPELLLSTAVDVTELKQLREQFRDLPKELCARPAPGTDPSASALTQELANHLQKVNQTLRPENLEAVRTLELKQFITSVERMKVLMEELAMNQVNINPET